MELNGFQQRIAELEKQLAVLIVELRCVTEARDLQAKEYERRLAELNHAHMQQLARNADYVPRELWETRNLEIDSWRREVDKWRWISIGAASLAGSAAGLLSHLL